MFHNLITSFDLTVLLRLLTAAVLGAIVGFERERSGKVAGLRTHALVSLGAALFAVISILTFLQFPSVSGTLGYDYHLIANIIVGIGFIGAGTILRKGERVEGITTAASLWVVAAVGIASGMGFYKEAVATTVFVYAILTLLWWVEKRLSNTPWYKGIPEEHNHENHEPTDSDAAGE